MTPRDFIYWLKGYFEIPQHEQSAALTAQQLKIIRRHLAMLPVAKYNPDKVCIPAYGNDFCNWLNDYIKESEDDLSVARTVKIQRRLDELFEHVATKECEEQ